MRLTENDKSFLAGIIGRIYKNVATGEMAFGYTTTDESLMFSFDESHFNYLKTLYNKFAKEYQI